MSLFSVVLDCQHLTAFYISNLYICVFTKPLEYKVSVLKLRQLFFIVYISYKLRTYHVRTLSPAKYINFSKNSYVILFVMFFLMLNPKYYSDAYFEHCTFKNNIF